MQKGPKAQEKTKEGTMKLIETQDKNIITIIKSQMSKILIMPGAK